MGAELSVVNNRWHKRFILQANIYTPGQGICLQRLKPEYNKEFIFNQGLAYGSWYDIQIVARSGDEEAEPRRYLKKGVYLTIGKTIEISELTNKKHRDHGVELECGACKEPNIGSVAICEHCHTNKSQTFLAVFSLIPIVGIPFSVTDAVFRCGKSVQSNKTSDKIDAGITVIFAGVDIVTAPFIISSLAKIPGKIAAESGVKFTVKNIFTEAGKPLLKELTKELGKDSIVGAVKITKETIKTAAEKIS